MNLVTRREWKARKPKKRDEKNLEAKSTGHWNGPHLTVGGHDTWDHSNCAGLVRGVQNYHMDGHGWSDIAYNFVLCPHGYMFEGRGINVINAANGTNEGNRTSHAIMWLAGEGNEFTDVQKTSFKDAVRYVSEHSDAPNDAIGHRDHHSTQCPGDERYVWIHAGMPVPHVPTPKPPPPAVPSSPNSFGNWPQRKKPLVKLRTAGEAVRYLQNVISKKAGGNIQVNGRFDATTESRVKNVQKQHGLKDDGVVGPKTWAVIDKLASS